MFYGWNIFLHKHLVHPFNLTAHLVKYFLTHNASPLNYVKHFAKFLDEYGSVQLLRQWQLYNLLDNGYYPLHCYYNDNKDINCHRALLVFKLTKEVEARAEWLDV